MLPRSGHISSSLVVAAISSIAFGLVAGGGGIANLPPAADPARTSGQGSILIQYGLDLPEGYAIRITANGRPEPFKADCCHLGDLEYYNKIGPILYSSGKMAVLDSSQTSYTACKSNTRYTTQISSPPAGTTVCFTGHGLVASVQITQVTPTGSGHYLSLSVIVWNDY